jgi:hypothetical protein
MNKFATFITSICGTFCLNLPGDFKTPQHPNVILIIADDLNTKVGFLNEKIIYKLLWMVFVIAAKKL